MSVVRFDHARLLALVRAGHPDQAVAEALDCSRSWVQKVRKAAGLKANRPPVSEERRAQLRAIFDRLRRKYGVRSLRELDAGTVPRRDAEFAARYGLPPMPRAQVLILVQLTTGPKTALQLVTALGKRFRGPRFAYHAFNCPKLADKNHLEALRRSGLVARWIPAAEVRGRGQNIYFATATALEMMRAAGTNQPTR